MTTGTKVRQVMSKNSSGAQHQARNDAWGSKEKGQRKNNSGGDRPTKANYSQAYEIGQKYGLHPKSKKS